MREIFSMNKDWKFRKDDEISCVKAEDYFNMFENNTKTGVISDIKSNGYYDEEWKTVNLPHDWCITEPVCTDFESTQGYKPQGKVWYRKRFSISKKFSDKRIFLKFDGITGESTIYFNNIKIAQSYSSYTPLFIEITDIADFSKDNTVCVECDNSVKEGWWYEGGGIYRNTYLIIKDNCCFENDGIFVAPKKIDNGWRVEINSEQENCDENYTVVFKCGEYEIQCNGKNKISCSFDFKNPKLWDIDEPYLYTLHAYIMKDEKIIDNEEIKFGFRQIKISTESGFVLNDKKIKLKGVCLHHDHCGVGTAMTYDIHYFRLKKLKQMGCNAIRTSHNPQSPEFYHVCDTLGIIVMNEVRHFSSTVFGIDELTKFIKRDRNHPCVAMWSLFNEEPLQGSVTGEKIARTMRKTVEKYDNTRFVTGGMNGPIELNGVVNVVDIMGFNYLQYGYDEFHKLYPDMPVLGSETGSYLSTRGEYITDKETSHVSAYGRILNENLFHWSATPGDTWKNIAQRNYVIGGFYWTGIDYRGETGPFHWPGVTSNFGAMDICCFPKDNFYWHKAMWDENEHHVFISPHWNFKENENASVICYSDCDTISLYVNEKKICDYKNDVYNPEIKNIPFQKGSLKAIGSIDGKAVCEHVLKTAENAERIIMEYDENSVCNVYEYIVVNVKAVDKNNTVVPYFEEEVNFEIPYGGQLYAIGNGDNACHTVETSDKIKFFHGLCQIIIKPYKEKNKIIVRAHCKGIEESISEIYYKTEISYKQIESLSSKSYISNWRMSDIYDTYPPKNDIHNDMFTWIPTVIGGKSLMMSQKKGYATVAGTVMIPDENKKEVFKVNVEKLKGKVDIYIDGKLIYSSDKYENKDVSCEYKPIKKGTKASLAFVFHLNGDDCGIYGNVFII